MKTKIIYISGAEVFDMAEIRAAFDEVRDALGLASDTIMFGVPVDADNALCNTNDKARPETIIAPDVDEPQFQNPAPISETIHENQTIVDITPKPEKTAHKSRAARVVDVIDAPVIADVAPVTVKSVDDIEPEKVIPILSILAANQDEPVTSPAEDSVTETVKEPVDVAPETVDAVETAEIAIIEEPIVAESITETVSIDEAEMTDDAPVAPVEKTLEQLLESMTPLREDVQPTDIDAESQIMDDMPMFDDANSADATLEQLASEFAENQDKIVPAPRAENHGKIGKLKNILPFKKIKRDDNSLMGDLFGWAGIAANDDEFSMPGFFTSAASKK